MTDQPAIHVREARREDVAAIVRLLADDHLGKDRETVTDPPLPAYFAAFDKVAADPRNLLVVAEDPAGKVIGTLQITFIPGLSNRGADLALLEAVRIDSSLRGQGLGQQFVAWALDEARRRGCRAMELLTHNARPLTPPFYEKLGFTRSHQGMRRML
jgi:GNAT superfamily N-acetyltransferase